MKLSLFKSIPVEYTQSRFADLFGRIEDMVNQLAEGRITASYNAMTAAPTSGTWKVGDFVKNSAPSELGSASSKYVVIGFVCVSGGTPGTWKDCRCLTGN